MEMIASFTVPPNIKDEFISNIDASDVVLVI